MFIGLYSAHFVAARWSCGCRSAHVLVALLKHLNRKQIIHKIFTKWLAHTHIHNTSYKGLQFSRWEEAQMPKAMSGHVK